MRRWTSTLRLASTLLRHCSSSSSSPSPSSSTALLALNDQISQILVSRADTLVGRMITNVDADKRPWEASCIEVERPSKKPSSSRFCATSSQQQQQDDEHQQDPAAGSMIVLYYETSTHEGLLSFRSIAGRVARKELPGETENRTSVGGYAVWRLPAKDFLILNNAPRLE